MNMIEPKRGELLCRSCARKVSMDSGKLIFSIQGQVSVFLRKETLFFYVDLCLFEEF